MRKRVTAYRSGNAGKRKFITITACIALLSQCFCASEQSSVQRKPTGDTTPPAEMKEAEIDIEKYMGNDFVIPPTQWIVETAAIDTALPFVVSRSEPDTGIHPEDQKINGWRVQIFTSDNFESASSVLEQVRLEFPDIGVYMHYEPPYYRIRIGDAQSIIDAEILMRRAEQMGYQGAFRVPSEVFLYPELRIQASLPEDSLSAPADSTDFEAMPEILPFSP